MRCGETSARNPSSPRTIARILYDTCTAIEAVFVSLHMATRLESAAKRLAPGFRLQLSLER